MVQEIKSKTKSSKRSGFDLLLAGGMFGAAFIIALMSSFTWFDQIALFIFLIVMVLSIVGISKTLLAICAGGATILSLGALFLVPHLVHGQSLLVATNGIALWPAVILCSLLGLFAHQRNVEWQNGPAAPHMIAFIFSTLFYGLGLLLALQAGIAAWGLDAGQSIWAVTRHAFAAETPIHTLVLSLWFGLIVRSLMRIQSDMLLSNWSRNEHISKIDYFHIEAISRLLPMLGFLGTVIGLAAAVASISGQLAADSAMGSLALATLFKNLAVKFETSLLGLMGSITMSVFLSMIESRQRWNSENHGHSSQS